MKERPAIGARYCDCSGSGECIGVAGINDASYTTGYDEIDGATAGRCSMAVAAVAVRRTTKGYCSSISQAGRGWVLHSHGRNTAQGRSGYRGSIPLWRCFSVRCVKAKPAGGTWGDWMKIHTS